MQLSNDEVSYLVIQRKRNLMLPAADSPHFDSLNWLTVVYCSDCQRLNSSQTVVRKLKKFVILVSQKKPQLKKKVHFCIQLCNVVMQVRLSTSYFLDYVKMRWPFTQQTKPVPRLAEPTCEKC